MTVLVELAGLEVPGRHGATPEEHEQDQPFLYDLELELAEPRADRIEETVDYREVVELVREVSASQERQILETLAVAVADGLMQRFPLERARVRVRKPEVRLEAPVEWTAATAERSRR
jgi:dihydroneopterin aldolase